MQNKIEVLMGYLFKSETLSSSSSDSLKILNSHGSSRTVNPWLKCNAYDNELLYRHQKASAPFFIISLDLDKSMNHSRSSVFLSAKWTHSFIHFIPSLNTHLFKFNKTRFCVEIDEDKHVNKVFLKDSYLENSMDRGTW